MCSAKPDYRKCMKMLFDSLIQNALKLKIDLAHGQTSGKLFCAQMRVPTHQVHCNGLIELCNRK